MGVPLGVQLIPAGLAVAGGLLDALFGGQLSSEQKRALGLAEENVEFLQQVAEEGLTPEQEANILASISPTIEAGANVRQRAVAASAASAGMSRSSDLLQAISNIPRTGDIAPGIIAGADIRAMQTAMGALPGAIGQFANLANIGAGQQSAAAQRGFGAVAGGLNLAFDALSPDEPTISDILSSLPQFGGGGATTEAIPQQPILTEAEQRRITAGQEARAQHLGIKEDVLFGDQGFNIQELDTNQLNMLNLLSQLSQGGLDINQLFGTGQ
jgi:hypothetical protein